MVASKKGKFGNGEVSSPNKGSSRACSKERKTVEDLVEVNHGESELRALLKQVVEDAIRNFFQDSQNNHILIEHVVQHGSKFCLPQNSPRRDISNDEIIRPRDLPQATGLSKTQIWRLSKLGLFVKKLKLSNGCVGYLRSDVETWRASRQII